MQMQQFTYNKNLFHFVKLLSFFFSRAILAFTLLGLLALVTFGPSLLGAFGGGSGSGSYGNYNRNGFDYYE